MKKKRNMKRNMKRYESTRNRKDKTNQIHKYQTKNSNIHRFPNHKPIPTVKYFFFFQFQPNNQTF